MKVLLIGSGGREHALAWAMAASPVLTKLYAAPGNPGIAREADIVTLDINDHGAVAAFCRDNAIDLVAVGPEAPLAAGIADDLSAQGISVFGPSKAAAQLESSKHFTKTLCEEEGIPTARFKAFTDAEEAKAHIRLEGAPIVVKADGLAAGKGVVIADTVHEAERTVDRMFAGAFGAAGNTVIIEEKLEGEEASVFALCDGETALFFGSAQDHKRAYDGDTGPNTGGMGAFSPAPIITSEIEREVMETIITPTVTAMAARGMPFKGVLYAGLMMTASGPKLIEYNVRFGDPECQVLMMRLKDDLLLLMKASCDGVLATMSARWYDEVALTVVLAAQGYPGDYEKGSVIGNLAAIEALEDIQVFHAGTTECDGSIVANGGRVLNITTLGNSVYEAQQRAYTAIDQIDWPEGFCRRDIGWRAIG